jgi:hypothetical protein
MPASARHQDDLAGTHLFTRHRATAGGSPWSRHISILAPTMTHVAHWTPVGADKGTREGRPATATTLVAVDTTTAVRTGARASIHGDLGLLADASSTWLSPHGIDHQRTSRNTLGKRTPACGLRITGSLVEPAVWIAITSLSATSPCSWPTQHEHGWSTSRPTGFKAGRT